MPVTFKPSPGGIFNGYLEGRKRQAKEDENRDPLCLRQAMEDYKIRILSGNRALTEEEKELIREKIAAWLEENCIETEEGQKAFKLFVKDIYRLFGARHDLEYFLEQTMFSATGIKLDLSFLRREIIGNGTLINFDGVEADRVPSRMFPLQYQLHNEDED